MYNRVIHYTRTTQFASQELIPDKVNIESDKGFKSLLAAGKPCLR